jgi:hypothetical protein
MTISAGSAIGQAGKLYYNSGTNTSPVWVEIKRAKDVSCPLTKGEADVSRRESAWEMFIGALKSVGLNFGYQHKRGTDSVRTALLASFVSGTPMQFAVMDQDITADGALGAKFYGEVFEFPLEQPLKDGQTVACVVKATEFEEPAGTLIEPTILTVTGTTTTTTTAAP